MFWESNPTNIKSPSGECFAGDGNTLTTGGEGFAELGEGFATGNTAFAGGGNGLAEGDGRIARGGNELAGGGEGVADSGGLSFVAIGFAEGDGVIEEGPQLFPDGSGGDRSAQRPAFSIRRVQKLVGVLVVELKLVCVPIQFHAGCALGRDAEKHHFGELPAVVGKV